MDSTGIFVGVILLFIASVFAYILKQMWDSDEETLSIARMLIPIVVGMFILSGILLTGLYRKFNIIGAGLATGGLLFGYIGYIIKKSFSDETDYANTEYEKNNSKMIFSIFFAVGAILLIVGLAIFMIFPQGSNL